MSTAAEWKQKGTVAFTSGNLEEAKNCFSEAIGLEPENHLLYGNRAAVAAKQGDYEASLADAKRAVEICPTYAKGHGRIVTAYELMNRAEDAMGAIDEGLKHCPEDAALTSLRTRLSSKSMQSAFMQMFQTAARNDPSLAAEMGSPEFQAMMADMQANPNNINQHLTNPLMQKVLQAALPGMGQAPPAETAAPEPAEKTCPRTGKPCCNSGTCHGHGHTHAHAEPEVEAEPEVSEEDKAKATADAIKDEGNKLYKSRDFDGALAKYAEAIAVHDCAAYHLNRAAALMAQDKLDEAMEECIKAETIAWEARETPEQKCKVLTRKATVFEKQKKYQEAVDTYNKAMLERRDRVTLTKLRSCEKTLRAWKAEQYLDPARAAEAKAEGNKLFSEQKYPDAIKCFTEAIKRDPGVSVYYSNRAACYLKLMEYRLAEADGKKAVELDGSNIKALVRMGRAQLLTKRLHKALDTFTLAMSMDPTNVDAKQGHSDVTQQIVRMQTGQMSEAERTQVREASMQDPEVKQLIEDPAMQHVLQSMADPKAAQEHMANPEVAAKIQRLVAAGIVGTGPAM